jgi:uncharacterized Zn finger protein
VVLRKVRDTMIRAKQGKEWQSYIAGLREENKRKPRCVQVLDGLIGKPIIR